MKIHCKYDELVAIENLKPHPKNRNNHPKDQIKRLAKILDYQGWRYPVKVSKQTGFVTSGHGRIESAKENGWKDVPVSFQDYETSDMEIADLNADNEIARWADLDLSGLNDDIKDLGPDFDIEMLGIKNFTIDVVEKGLCDEDEIPEHVQPKTKPGDLYQLGNHRLLCGDSTNIQHVEKLMAGEKADLVFTDPPYGISIVKTGTDGASARVGFVSPKNAPSQVAKAREYRPIEGDGEPFDPNLILGLGIKITILWGANHYASRLPDRPQWLIWDKKLESGELDHNDFSDCELAWTNQSALSAKIYRHTWAGMLRKGNRKEELKDRVHPTQKPVGLCADIIEDFSKPNESVIDLYLGSGSTLIACEKTGRRFFGMEIDPHYVDIIVARWEKFTGKKAEKL